MAVDTTGSQNGNWFGFILTSISFLYAKITASDLASVFTGLLAVCNLVIIWPKLKPRLAQIRAWMSKKKTNPHE